MQNNMKRILLGEDDEISQIMLKLRFEGLGCCVSLARDADEAVNQARLEQYDLVLLDLNMPGKSGFDAARQIRSIGGKYEKEIPVIVITATVDEEIQAQCIDAGVTDCLQKPVDDSTMEYIERKWISPEKFSFEEQTMSDDTDRNSFSEAIDYEQLLKDIGGDRKTGVKLLGILREELPESLSKLERFSAQRDISSIASEAHKLKGSAINIGAKALHKAATTLEMTAKCGRFDRLDELVSKVEQFSLEVMDCAAAIIEREGEI